MHRHAIAITMVIAVVVLMIASTAPADAIIDGQPDGNGHPNVGAIDARPTGRLVPCTGTLISTTVLLTAGHCGQFFKDAGLTTAKVTFDPNFFSAAAVFFTGDVHVHPGFSKRRDDPSDIAVIVFATPIPNIVPASLPTAGLLDQLGPQGLKNQTLIAVGYGISKVLGGPNGGGQPEIDRASSGTRRTATHSFQSLTAAWLRVSMDPTTPEGGACTGDSGSPRFLGSSNMTVSVDVAGDLNCRAMAAGLRVDTPSVRGFLANFPVTLP